jgi:ubiquinone/menaquinone biosynthesis C-methylase UbiE
MQKSDTGRFRKFYENEAARYHSSRYRTRYGALFEKWHHEIIRDLLVKLPDDDMVLEIACGTGHLTSLLADLGLQFVSSDLTPEMMQQARARAGMRGNFILTNAFRLPFPDGAFSAVVSSRFLHLFNHTEQEHLLREMLRVLRPGGILIVDFDNFTSRWLWAIPYLIYNLIRYHRIAPYAVYNRIGRTESLIQRLGVQSLSSIGVGGTHLVLPALISRNFALRLGRYHRHGYLRHLSEQFIVSGVKAT